MDERYNIEIGPPDDDPLMLRLTWLLEYLQADIPDDEANAMVWRRWYEMRKGFDS
jgi:hypothetical protein